MTIAPDGLATPKEVAAFLNKDEYYLTKLRYEKRGPKIHPPRRWSWPTRVNQVSLVGRARLDRGGRGLHLGVGLMTARQREGRTLTRSDPSEAISADHHRRRSLTVAKFTVQPQGQPDDCWRWSR